MTLLQTQKSAPKGVGGTLAPEVLADARFQTVPYADRHQSLAERLVLDFSAILYTLDHVPLALNGVAHADQRADVARFLAERRGVVEALLPQLAGQAAAVIGVPGAHDFMGEVLVPLVDGLIEAMIELPLELGHDSLVSRIFSQKIGVAQRRRLQAELTRLLARMEAKHPGDSDLRRGTRIALIVLGRDALIGTLAQSLHEFFRGGAGQPLSAQELSVPPTHTGVPYIDRKATCPMHIGGEDVAEGEVLRCQLASFDNARPAERLRFFGAGAHLCLGRMVTLDLFKALAAALQYLSVKVQVTRYGLREDDVFHYPAYFEIEVAGE